MKKKFFIILWLTCVMPGLTGHLAQAQPADRPWTLQECIGYALDHNLNVQQSALQVQQREIDLNTAMNNRLPGVSAVPAVSTGDVSGSDVSSGDVNIQQGGAQ